MSYVLGFKSRRSAAVLHSGFGFVTWGVAEPFTELERTGNGNIAAWELGTGKYFSWDTSGVFMRPRS